MHAQRIGSGVARRTGEVHPARTVLVVAALLLGASGPAAAAPGAPVIIEPQPGSLHGSHVTISGTAEPGATVIVREGIAVIGRAPVDGDGRWALGATFASGLHTVTATAHDASGGESDPSDPRTFRVDTFRPAVIIATPERTIFGPGGTFTVEGTASDNVGVHRIEVEYFSILGVKSLRLVVPADPQGEPSVTWSATAQGLLPGLYAVRATAIDLIGLRSAAASKTYVVLTL